jgi:hypothetical protein
VDDELFVFFFDFDGVGDGDGDAVGTVVVGAGDEVDAGGAGGAGGATGPLLDLWILIATTIAVVITSNVSKTYCQGRFLFGFFGASLDLIAGGYRECPRKPFRKPEMLERVCRAIRKGRLFTPKVASVEAALAC